MTRGKLATHILPITTKSKLLRLPLILPDPLLDTQQTVHLYGAAY